MVTSGHVRNIEVQDHVRDESCLVIMAAKVVLYVEGDPIRSRREVTAQEIADPAVVVGCLARLQSLVLPIHPPESNVNSGCGLTPRGVENVRRYN